LRLLPRRLLLRLPRTMALVIASGTNGALHELKRQMEGDG
jgi:hypothetical protein